MHEKGKLFLCFLSGRFWERVTILGSGCKNNKWSLDSLASEGLLEQRVGAEERSIDTA